MKRKEDKHAFWKLNYELWINYSYCKESTKIGELLASIVFNNSFGLKNHNY